MNLKTKYRRLIHDKNRTLSQCKEILCQVTRNSMGALSCKKCKRFIGKLEWRMPFYESCLAFEI